MNGVCPTCKTTRNVRARRGDKISNYACLSCGGALRGVTIGSARGRYLCPITNFVVTLGQTALQLEKPSELIFRPGIAPSRLYLMKSVTHVNDSWRQLEPSTRDRDKLNRVAGRILGPGCVVNPDPGWFQPWCEDAAAGLRLEPVDDPGSASSWFVNEPLTYRKCVACGSPTPDIPEHRPSTAWKPVRTYVMRGRGRLGRYQQALNLGPHPAGSLACGRCKPVITCALPGERSAR